MKAPTAGKPGIGLKPTSRRSWPVEHWSSAGSMTLAPSRGVAASMCRTCCLLWSPSVPGWSYVLGFQFRSFPKKVGRLRQLCSRVAGQPPTPSDQLDADNMLPIDFPLTLCRNHLVGNLLAEGPNRISGLGARRAPTRAAPAGLE